MTYSIVARCPRTGRFGVGSTTFSIACGRRNESIRPNVGISKSQAFYLRQVDPLALNLLEMGYKPSRIMQILEADEESLLAQARKDVESNRREFGPVVEPDEF